MTLAIVLFLLATAVLLLLVVPLSVVVSEMEELWPNIKFWSVVIVAWTGVWIVASYGI